MTKKILMLLVILVAGTTVVWAAGGSETQGASDDSLSAILIIPGNLGDLSFFDSANAGMNLLESELGATIKVVEAGTDSTKWEPALYDAIDGDWDLIITGSSITELLNTIAPQYPDQMFINFDTSIEETPDNVYSMFYSTNDIGFLAGTVAALVTTSGLPLTNDEAIIGFLGGMDIPGINDFLVGYIEGALLVNPDIQVITSYAGNFGDPAKGKELTLVQYSAGADISYNVAGGTGLGLLDAAKVSDAYAIGVDSDQAMLFAESDPVKAAHIVTSTVKRIDQAILFAVTAYLDGTLEFGTHDVLGLKEGAVGLAKNEYFESILNDEIKAAIIAAEQAVIDGEIVVSSAFGMTTEEIADLRDSVAF